MAKTQPELTNQQLALAIHLNEEATLADFCWNNNHLLEQQLQLILQNQGERTLYLWGNSGSGKSHLLQGCCQEVAASQAAVYLPMTVLKEWGPQSIEDIEGQHFICIDDIDAIAGHKEWEEALFHLYNRIKENGRSQLIMSGKLPPAAMPILLADLKSRLSWGLVLHLHELCDEDKIKTLKHHAQKRGFNFPANVGQYLINRCSRNMHDLNLLLHHLDKASLAAQRKITIPFVKATLKI
ncbi:DnaA regulatory inactivator Hda [Legionella israelensis]|uniref:ATPase regulatory factor involved in DnaA inactivation n=1 Tax=Legionella israelensis TaxID=454 RepID=A0A0W0V4I1_9GAMM|nr:DnaA regulatory inactivator Hda [Legionella israelensis]KTD15035.1 ATPase regulatory factor involved in DnaA inactivation [Legionella israelensis]QBR85133.1 DnaA regulatory inactivator Hda [Legionella israelensis]QBS09973.1 DnaA regulatory inactivator Hda [Legionella israelensis]SCX77534.1 regulatory inactivation of DnaA Hda protein [Legionella israelensis DSM 19235]STX59547.1 ATPase regulatory factor involved in DnaA inactivation [Legionella israelensis]